ncbi:MAG: hypothetical protein M9925_12080, partial [Chloroflexi bacterium]|nr:hypothetical protein [Chloroflexota bacterium]
SAKKRLAHEGIGVERVSTRTKTMASLLRKFLKKGYMSYEDVKDKVGVRVILRFSKHVEDAALAVQQELGGSVDNKNEQLGVESFDYRSIHLDIIGLPNGMYLDMPCEVQFRTACEDAWAVMSHHIKYKSPLTIPEQVRRGQAALAALFELADTEYERQYEQLTSMPEFSTHMLLDTLETAMAVLSGIGLTSEDFDRELSLLSIEALCETYNGLSSEQIAGRIDEYVRDQEDSLKKHLAALQKDDQESVFARQPEAIMVAERLHNRSLRLRDAWNAVYPPEELDRLAFALGYSAD